MKNFFDPYIVTAAVAFGLGFSLGVGVYLWCFITMP